MELNSNRMFLATAVTVAATWIVCTALVVLMPSAMATLTGQLVHVDLSDMVWSLNATGFFVGLIVWSLLIGFMVWVIARIYNRLAA